MVSLQSETNEAFTYSVVHLYFQIILCVFCENISYDFEKKKREREILIEEIL